MTPFHMFVFVPFFIGFIWFNELLENSNVYFEKNVDPFFLIASSLLIYDKILDRPSPTITTLVCIKHVRVVRKKLLFEI